MRQIHCVQIRTKKSSDEMTQLLTILEMSMVIEPMAGDDDETVFALMPQMGYLTIDASHRWADQTVSAINKLEGWSAIRIRTGDVTRG